jgi:hypothetical protein
VSFWVEIVCDRCAESGPGKHVRGGRYPERDLEAVARKRGWAVKKEPGGWTVYLCGECIEKTIKAGTLNEGE